MMKKDWIIKKLGEVCEIARGGSPRPIKDFITTDESGVNWIKIGDTDPTGKYIFQTAEKIKPAGISKSRFVEEGDFLLSNSMSFGRPYILKTNGCIHDGWLVLKKYEQTLFIDFFYYLLLSPNVQNQFNIEAKGSTVRNLNTDIVSKIKVSIPPLEEQKRIVAVLDKKFAQIETLKTAAEKNLQNTKQLFQAELEKAFSNTSWEKKCLGDTCTITSSKRIFKDEYVEEGIPFYRTKELKELAHGKEITLELFISKSKYEEIKKQFGVPHIGDVLISAVGTIGEVLIIENDNPFYFKDGNIIWLKDIKGFDSDFLKYQITSMVEQLKDMTRGAAYNALTIEKLKEYKIFLPPISEQKRIVAHLDSLSEKVHQLEEIYTKQLADCEELKQSLLHKAFEGEL